jgi:parvulin-like peptidyl-prolyl isomerase
VFFLSACASSQTPAAASSTQANNAALPAQTQVPTAAPVAARVNGQVITLAELDRAVTRRLDGIKSMGDPLPTDTNAFRLNVLDALIQQVVIEQAAAIQGVTVTDADVQAELDATIKIAGSKENWEAQVKAENMTEAEYRAGLRSTLITEKMRDIVTVNACKNIEEAHARHILVADEATASQIKSQLDGGADFATLAAKYSQDVTTRQIGGDLGWFARGQLLQPAVEEAAFSLPLNAISAPVKSELGYHIIQTLERSQNRPIDPETCSRLTQSAFERWMQDLVNKAKIEKYPNGQA